PKSAQPPIITLYSLLRAGPKSDRTGQYKRGWADLETNKIKTRTSPFDLTINRNRFDP
ncbi:hypothetical protein HAX54_008628, partial [Datura stramonium]|nr:hypothetical protein [Datura stramonium]